MFDEFIDMIETLGIPYFRQGSWTGETIPDEYLTYWNVDGVYSAKYDNLYLAKVEDWEVTYNTKDPRKVYSGMETLLTTARAYGFVPTGTPKDLRSDQTGVYRRMVVLRRREELRCSSIVE